MFSIEMMIVVIFQLMLCLDNLHILMIEESVSFKYTVNFGGYVVASVMFLISLTFCHEESVKVSKVSMFVLMLLRLLLM
jgi:hypothetical protein